MSVQLDDAAGITGEPAGVVLEGELRWVDLEVIDDPGDNVRAELRGLERLAGHHVAAYTADRGRNRAQREVASLPEPADHLSCWHNRRKPAVSTGHIGVLAHRSVVCRNQPPTGPRTRSAAGDSGHADLAA